MAAPDVHDISEYCPVGKNSGSSIRLETSSISNSLSIPMNAVSSSDKMGNAVDFTGPTPPTLIAGGPVSKLTTTEMASSLRIVLDT
jgi:hypothetical protein